MADHLSMSDEDFLKQPLPETGEVSASEKPSESEPKQEETPAPEPVVETPAEEKEIETPEPEERESIPDPTGSTESEKPTEQVEEKPKEEVSIEQPTVDYKATYEKIMAPFVANGKTIELKSPEEAIQLMQMGANYTRKMQEIAPHRKLITMLQNNNLDESKLSFLIDLDKRDPEAIKKLIKDSGLDPLDIDTNSESAYQEGNHRVTDQEVNFRTQLDELSSSDTGKQTLLEIDRNWDQASKDKLWDTPELMPIINQHRESGIYNRISDEINRQRTLGRIPPTTPFIEAYYAIGDELDKAGILGSAGGGQQEGQAPSGSAIPASSGTHEPAVVTVRSATPKPTVNNGDKVGAAALTRSAPGKAKEVTNFLSMSDDEFLKSDAFKGRV